MTDPKISITEDELHAYVDNELPTERRGDVEAWLAAHPDDAARVQSWREMAEALHARYDSDAGRAGRAPALCRRGAPSGRGARKRTHASAAVADQALRLGRPCTGVGRDGVEARWRAIVAGPCRACILSDV